MDEHFFQDSSRVANPGELLAQIGDARVPALTNADADDSVELSPSDYFLLSRVDGRTPIKALRQMAGMGRVEFDETFVRVLASGLVRVPGVPRTNALDIVLAKVTGAHAAIVTEEPLAIGSVRAGASAARGAPSAADEPAIVSPAAVQSQRSETRGGSPQEAPTTLLNAPEQTGGAESAEAFSDAVESETEVVESLEQASPSPSSLEEYLKAASQPGAELPMSEAARGRSSSEGKDKYRAPPKQNSRQASKPQQKLTMALVPATWPVPIEQFTFDPETMSTGTALNIEHKQVVLYYHYHLRRVTYYQLLGIGPQAGRRELKHAYFQLSKAFHPDRWYRQDTGDFGEMIEDVFKWLNRAYGVLSSPRKRKGYDKLVGRGYIGEWQLEKAPAPKWRREPSKSSEEPVQAGNSKRTIDVLAARALRASNDGEWQEACELYLRLLEVQNTPDLRIRLVECMLKANMEPHEIDRQLALTESDGPRSVFVTLLEAEIARRLDDFPRAEACFRQVIDLEPANPVARLGLERLGAEDPIA